jgi:hypothetical protein
MSCCRGSAAVHGVVHRQFAKIVILAFSLALAGCGVTRDQLDAAGAFGKSAATLADGVKDAYAQADQAEIETRLASHIVAVTQANATGKIPSTETIWNSYVGRDPASKKWLNRPFAATRIGGRLAAAEALKAYGKALETLLDSKTQEKDFSDAVTSLSGAVKGLPESLRKTAGITPDDINGVGAIVVALGNIALDYQRRKALEEVVPAAEPTVTKICALFSRDFNAGDGATIAGLATAGTTTALDNVEQVFKNEFASAALKDGYKADAGSSMQNRAVLLPLYAKIDSINTRTRATFASVKDAADSCVKASRALAKAVKDPQVTMRDIIAFVEKAQAAFNAVKSLSESTKGS